MELGERRECLLGELCDRGLAELQTGPFGSQLHAYDYVNDGVPVVPTEAIRERKINHDVLPKITDTKAAELMRHRLRVGDILFARRGVQATGHTGFVRDAEDGFICGTGAIRLRITTGNSYVIAEYLSHVFANPASVEWFKFHAIGATMPNLNEGIIRSFPLSLPPLDTQAQVSRLLSALDDKIELNRRMNETLEAMARAIFKDWFVDFGPTRAKAEGRTPYLAPDLWDLFPDSLDDEDKPVGWTEASIYDFSDVVYGAPFASKQFNSEDIGVPLIRIRDLATHAPGVSTEQVHKKGHVIEPGDIVVGMDGEFRLHIWKGPKAWLNQRVCHFEPRPGIPKSFLAEALKEPLAFFERGKVGTTVIHLGKSDIDTFKLTHPADGVLDAFAKVAEPLLERTVSNALESRTLAQTRDLLVPKLMSGEIRLAEADKAMEAVA